MNTKEIRQTCINGTQAYSNYLEKNDKGLQRIKVRVIEALPRHLFRIVISGKLFDTEAVFFLFKTENKKLNTSQVQVVSYDANSKTMLLRPEEKYWTLFEDLNHQDLEIISDLKFLVERVRLWYEKNGGGISLPSKASQLKGTTAQISYFEDMLPSANQKKAIQTIFDYPFSYIWGAPGTGKTQGVLSYALLHYLSNNCKVAILGPTNNAIEQVLRGVISMTDQAGIPRDKIIRLGNPSKTFADEFPEVCEARGIVKQLEDLDKQAQIIEKILLFKSHEKLMQVLDTGDGIFEELQEIKVRLDELVIIERTLLVKINGNKKKIERRKKQLLKFKQEIRQIDRRIHLLETKNTRLLAKESPKLEKQKEDFKKEFRVLEDEVDDFDSENELLELDWLASKEESKEQKEALASKIGFVKIHFKKNNGQSIVDNLLSGRVELVEAAIQGIRAKYQQHKIELGALAEAYEEVALDELQQELSNIHRKQEALQEYSTEERLKNVSITAATLDGYIGRFMEEKLNVQHIFVDEAGYANIVKVLTLFNHNVPITLLGDHMQLPPVCEINDKTIAQDNDYHDAFVWGQSAIFAEGVFYQSKLAMLEEYIKNAPLSPKKMKKADLNQTYRFGTNLAMVLDDFVYKNGFASANSQAQTLVYYIDAPKPSTEKKKRENNAEVLAIQGLLPQLDTDDFVILTPYRNQLKLLGMTLPSVRKNQQIITVHGSQGREWHTVILSVVDSYDKWFTDSKNDLSKGLNLINTAVSRAKKRLIIVSDARFWKRQKGQLLKGLLDIANEIE